MGSRFSSVAAEMERLTLNLLQAVKNIVGCGNVWNLQSHTDTRWKLYDYSFNWEQEMRNLAGGDQ